MEIIYDRRSGFDRRHRFLNGLDRRMSPPPPMTSAADLDTALGITEPAGRTAPTDDTRTAAYWVPDDDKPPIE
ncbi:MAG: hypothetical protein QM739_01525 [Propionivibrio sp.]